MILRKLLYTCLLGMPCLGAFGQSPTPASSSSEDKIRDIRTVFLQIDKDSGMNHLTLGAEEFLGDEVPDHGASLEGFFKGDTLCKMSTWIGLSYAVMKEHYYFSHGQLVFVYETEDDYSRNPDGSLNRKNPTRAFDARYYFDKDNVLQQLTSGKRKMGPDDIHHYLELYHNAHYYAGLLLKKRKAGAAGHKSPPAHPAQAKTT